MKQFIVTILFILFNFFACSQEANSINPEEIKGRSFSIFLAYDLGEMAFNKFQNFGGEIGLQFKNKHMLRFVYSNVLLTEAHLSSNFAQAVDGENVKGLYIGYELFYDVPIYKNLYLGASVGNIYDSYNHTILDESIENKTTSFGIGISYKETNLFKIKGTYFNLCIPVRYYLNPLEETKLGDTTINKHLIQNNIWFLIGYQF